MNENQNAESVKILAEYASLRKMSKAELKGIYGRSHRVCSLTDIDKGSLVSGILRSRHGNRRVDAAFSHK